MTDYFAGVRVAGSAKARPGRCYKKRQGGPGYSPSRDAVVQFVKDKIANDGAPPTLEEIRVKMDWKQLNSARDCVRKCGERLGRKVVAQILHLEANHA